MGVKKIPSFQNLIAIYFTLEERANYSLYSLLRLEGGCAQQLWAVVVSSSCVRAVVIRRHGHRPCAQSQHPGPPKARQLQLMHGQGQLISHSFRVHRCPTRQDTPQTPPPLPSNRRKRRTLSYPSTSCRYGERKRVLRSWAEACRWPDLGVQERKPLLDALRGLDLHHLMIKPPG